MQRKCEGILKAGETFATRERLEDGSGETTWQLTSHLYLAELGSRRGKGRLKVKLQRLTQIGKRFIHRFPLAGYVNFQRLGYVPFAFLIYIYTRRRVN